MMLIKNLIYVAMSALIMTPAIGAEILQAEKQAFMSRDSQSDYIKSVRKIFQAVDMDGAGEPIETDTKLYNTYKPLSGYEVYEGKEIYRISSDVVAQVQESAHCDLEVVGACFVVEADMNNKATAYYFTVAYEENIDNIRIFRKEVDMGRLANEVQYLFDVENGKRTTYTQADPSTPLKREERKEVEKKRKEKEGTEQDKAERAQIRYAIENNKDIDPALLRKHLPIQTEISAAEAAELEREAIEVYRAGGKDFKEIRANGVQSGMMTCYPVGTLERQRGRFFIAFNALFRNKMQPDLKGKGKLLCYNDGQLVVKINIEMKKYGFGLGLAIPEGTYKALSVGVGVASGPIDIITRKLPDGKLETFREWAFVLGVDAGFGVGGSLGLVGLSSGRQQAPLLSLFNASVNYDVLGASVDVFGIGRIGLDPDDF